MPLIKNNKTGTRFPSLLSDLFDADKFFAPTWIDRELESDVPSVNVKENSKEFNIELAAPGYARDQFKINVENDVLTISAERKDESKDENERYTRKEFSYNSFARSFTLPKSVNADKVDAKYVDGILKLCVHKKEESKVLQKREIQVS
jgi:HSP20 family protein